MPKHGHAAENGFTDFVEAVPVYFSPYEANFLGILALTGAITKILVRSFFFIGDRLTIKARRQGFSITDKNIKEIGAKEQGVSEVTTCRPKGSYNKKDADVPALKVITNKSTLTGGKCRGFPVFLGVVIL